FGSEALISSGLKFIGGDRLEKKSVTRADREMAGFGIGNAQWRRSEQVPATGRLSGIDACLAARDGHRSRRDAGSRRIVARQAGNRRREIACIGKTRLEADREDVVLDRAVQRRQLERAQVEAGSYGVQIGAVVKNRNDN